MGKEQELVKLYGELKGLNLQVMARQKALEDLIIRLAVDQMGLQSKQEAASERPRLVDWLESRRQGHLKELRERESETPSDQASRTSPDWRSL